ncbi:DUF444 family protein [bacterium]|nr:DUF444 family protein [bacterium]
MAEFRMHESADTRGDRSARDRLRHREKVKEAIKENIAEILSEEAIITRSGDRTVKVPIRGIKEYKFVYGDNAPGVAGGDGNVRRGQVVEPGQGPMAGLPDKAGDAPGDDIYETEVTIDELVNLMFEDIELPDMEKRKLADIESWRRRKTKGHRRKGIVARLDKRKTARVRVRRRMAAGKGRADLPEGDPGEPFPFFNEDLRYRHPVETEEKQANAVVMCIMDTSGSMSTVKKYLARSFFFLLHRFVMTRYPNVQVVFVAHTTEAREVDEDEFFHKGESGGTFISSGYNKALAIIEDRYHPSLWNIYAFHCSDGDNWPEDDPRAIEAANKLCECCNLFGYGEINPSGGAPRAGSMFHKLREVKKENFALVHITGRDDVWPQFMKMLAKESDRTEDVHE